MATLLNRHRRVPGESHGHWLSGLLSSALAGLLGAVAMAGCGGKPEPALFPLNPGLQWTYTSVTETTEGSVRAPLTIRSGSSVDVEGQTAAVRRTSDGNAWYLRSDESGIYRVATSDELREQPRKDPERRYVLQYPVAVGTNWRASTVPYLLKRAHEFPRELRHSHALDLTYTIEETDATVEVPAGSYSHCVRVRGQGDLRLFVDPVSGFQDVPIVTDEWYAPGVGLVKLVRSETLETRFLSGGRYTLELTGFGPD